MKEKITISLFAFIFISFFIQAPKEEAPAPVMIIESFGTVPPERPILPEDTIRFYLPDTVGYSEELEIRNPFYKTK